MKPSAQPIVEAGFLRMSTKLACIPQVPRYLGTEHFKMRFPYTYLGTDLISMSLPKMASLSSHLVKPIRKSIKPDNMRKRLEYSFLTSGFLKIDFELAA